MTNRQGEGSSAYSSRVSDLSRHFLEFPACPEIHRQKSEFSAAGTFDAGRHAAARVAKEAR